MISVVITTFNREIFLERSIRSVILQTYKDLEIIVVDNYSTTFDFLEFTKKFNDNRISWFQNNNNGVISVNRNYGILKSKGEYIAFLDDDDYWDANKIEIQISFFKDNDILGVGSSLHFVGSNTFYLNNRLKYNSKLSFKDIASGTVIPISTLVLKNNFDLFSESIEISSVEDWDFEIHITKKYQKSIMLLADKLVYYEVGPGNNTNLESGNIKGLIVARKYFPYLSTYEQLLLTSKLYRYAGIRAIKFNKGFPRKLLLSSLYYSNNIRNTVKTLGFLVLSVLPKSNLLFKYLVILHNKVFK